MNKPKYTTEECLKEYYDSLEEKLKEKDAMIDWLVFRLQSYCNNPLIINCSECRKHDCHNNNWRKAAQEAIKRND